MIHCTCRTALLACLTGLAAPAAAQDSAAVRIAHITYLTSASVYLDAGRLDGLREGTRVEVVRGRAAIGVLKVAFLASHQASCEIVTTSVALAVGDSARFLPVAAPRDSGLTSRSSPAAPLARRGATAPGLRGRIGAEYLGMDQLGAAGGFSQPSLALRLNGHPFAAPALTVAVDVRARRTYTNLSDGTALTDGRNRVYQAALTVGAPASPMRLTAGRQISGNLASVGVFDGVLAELNQGGWGTGVFAGTQPDPLQLDFSTQIVEAGAYVQGHGRRPGAKSHWSLTLGASGSYDGGQANREFGYVQGSFLGPRLWAFFTQEIDYYRRWKLLGSMDPVSPTNTFALLRYRVTGGVTLDAGFDNRRNVLLYRDVVNPATVFDDTYRQGAWAGCSIRFSGRFLLGVDARSSSGGPAGRADAYTMSFSAGPIARAGLSLRSRTTWYSSDQLTGWLQSVALGIAPGGRLHVELNGGGRQERNVLTDPPTNAWVTWFGADLDLNLARSWYLVVSANRETGGVGDNNQIYGGMSFRF